MLKVHYFDWCTNAGRNAPTTDVLELVTCGWCKSAITNAIAKSDWSKLSARPDLLTALRKQASNMCWCDIRPPYPQGSECYHCGKVK